MRSLLFNGNVKPRLKPNWLPRKLLLVPGHAFLSEVLLFASQNGTSLVKGTLLPDHQDSISPATSQAGGNERKLDGCNKQPEGMFR